MRRYAPMVVFLAAAAFCCGPASGTAPTPSVRLTPGIVQLQQQASIAVNGVDVPSLQARLSGATAALGRPLPWTTLHFARGAWRATLPLPELRGIYPVLLRVGPGARVLSDEHWLLHVFARGTLSRPLFDTPEGVARWWVRKLPARATLVALRRWPRPAFDRRDRRLHQLLVLAYHVAGEKDRLGIFVTAVRDGFHGRWRLLEATAAPA
jgi:hypothetical protein